MKAVHILSSERAPNFASYVFAPQLLCILYALVVRLCLAVYLIRRMKDGLLKTRDRFGSNASPLAGFTRLESGEDTSNNGQEGAA